jgi:gluconolactonase
MTETLLSIDNFAPFVEGLDHPEGVACGPDGYVYAGGEAGQIYRVSLEEGTYTQIANTDGFILGLCLDADCNIYACDMGNQAVMRITPDGEVTTYSNGSPDRKMVIPNYPIFDHEGNLYVSDSGERKKDNGCLFRIRPGGQTEVASEELRQFPNGVALSPDGSELYVVLSSIRGVVKVALHDNGQIGSPKPVVELPRAAPDGLAFDEQGNLYISCYTPNRIYRLTPDGDLAVLADDWEAATFAAPTNIAFCGPDRSTLVVANLAAWHLTKGQMPIPGSPIPYPSLYQQLHQS